MNQRQAGGIGDELTNAARIGLIGMFGIALVMRAAGSVTAFLTSLPQPDAGPAAGLGVLFNPADPATALASARRLMQLAEDRDAFVIYGHGPEQWPSLRKAPLFYD